MTKQTKSKGTSASLGGDLFKNPDAATLSGRVNKKLHQQMLALPFVKEGNGRGHCFWSVKSTGSYAADYQQGFDWAHLVLPFLKYNLGPVLVSWVVADMIRAGEVNGLVVGFTRGLAEHLKASRANLLVAAIMNDPKAPSDLKEAWPKVRESIYAASSDAI
jgi:hypothetical protein